MPPPKLAISDGTALGRVQVINVPPVGTHVRHRLQESHNNGGSGPREKQRRNTSEQ